LKSRGIAFSFVSFNETILLFSEHHPAMQSNLSIKRVRGAGGRTAAPSRARAGTPPRESGTVRRVLMVLRDLVDHPGDAPASMAARLNLPRSTVHRLLATLRAEDFAALDAEGVTRAGPELVRMAGRLRAAVPYAQLAEPVLRRLSERFGETSLLVLLERRQLRMFCACSAAPPDPMRYNIELHRLESLAWGATGRSILAFLSEAEVGAVIARAEPSPGDGQSLDAGELTNALAGIRRAGHAITRAHRTRGAVGLAVALFDAQRQVVGSVALLVPEFRYKPSGRRAFIDALAEASAEISRAASGG
jgi:DNA-binding IclR family transcriptional regulator